MLEILFFPSDYKKYDSLIEVGVGNVKSCKKKEVFTVMNYPATNRLLIFPLILCQETPSPFDDYESPHRVTPLGNLTFFV